MRLVIINILCYNVGETYRSYNILDFFVQGYAYLASRSSIQPFVCEISDPSVRGFTTTLWSLFFISGQAISILASNCLGWRWVSLFFAVLMVIFFFAIMLIHETPNWLLENLCFEKAVQALYFYKTDPKLLVYDENKRTSVDGSDLYYTDLVEMYRAASEKEQNVSFPQQNGTNNTWK